MQIKWWSSLLTLVMVVITQAAAISETLPCAEKLARAAMPRDVFYLPESQARQLNSALKEYGAVRLDPNGDYTRGFTIRMASNQALYGLAGTKVPNIIIEAGAENVIVSDVLNRKIIFPTSELVTSRNCFNRVRTSIEVKNTKLENNLFTDFQGGTIKLDDSRSGYIRNNRFIKTMTHTAWPALTILGNNNEPSYGNHFVWTNILGPLGDSVVVDRQQDIAFTGIDVESWSWGNMVSKKVPIYHPAAINVSNTDFISIFMSHGGNHRIKDAQYFGLDAKHIFLLGSDVETQAAPGLVLGEQVEQLLAINTREIGHKVSVASTNVTELFKDDRPQMLQNWVPVSGRRLHPPSLSGVNEILEKEQRVYEDWDKPVFGNIQTAIDLQGAPAIYKDASDLIQLKVNQDAIAELDAGIYYLSKPIKLKDGQGLVGAGQDKTILVATKKDMDLIVGDNRINDVMESTWFVLADLTLQGGGNGVHHAPAGSGKGAQYNRSILSHVTFRDMTNAGIYLESIYGWDNNFLDNVNFIRCGAAIMQRPSAAYKGGDVPGTTYMDKNVCYRCRFESNTIALDMPGKRGNGLNAFIDSKFSQNGMVIRAIHPLANFFANTVFIDNRGNPSIETNKSLGFVHSDFIQKIPGNLFQRYTLCNGCRFVMHPGGGSVITRKNNLSTELNLFINSNVELSVSKDMQSGLILGGLGGESADARGLLIRNNQSSHIFHH